MTRRKMSCNRHAAPCAMASISSHPIMLLLSMLLLGMAPHHVAAAEPDIQVQVVSVRSCDELAVRHNAKILAVRIAGIDCPGRQQPFAAESKSFVGKLVKKDTITVKPVGRDRQRRVWANVFLSNGRSVAYEMVKSGWAHVSASAVDERLAELEQDARRTKVGMWTDRHPVPTTQASGAIRQK